MHPIEPRSEDPAARSAPGISDRRSGVGGRLYTAHLATVWGIALSNVFQSLTVLWAGWLAWREPQRLRWHWPTVAPLMVPLAVFATLLVAAVAFSLDPSRSAHELDNLIILGMLPLAVLLIRGDQAVRRVVDVVLVMMVVVAVYGLVQLYTTDYGALENRIPGPFSHYQTFAGVLMVGDLLLLARMVSRDGWRRPLSWLALVLINWALMSTLTRGAWVGVGVTLTVYVLVRARRWLAIYIAVAVVILLLMPASWRGRIISIGDIHDPSNYDRLCMLEAGLHMIDERPLLGLGPAMVAERYPIYRHPTAPRFTVKHLHDTYLQIAAERGLLSLAAYLWMMMACARLAYCGYRREGGPRGPRADLYVGVMMVLLGFNLAGLFEANWRDSEVQRLVIFVMAIPLCLGPPPD